MTVKKLIEELQKQPQDLPVMSYDDGCMCDIKTVELKHTDDYQNKEDAVYVY